MPACLQYLPKEYFRFRICTFNSSYGRHAGQTLIYVWVFQSTGLLVNPYCVRKTQFCFSKLTLIEVNTRETCQARCYVEVNTSSYLLTDVYYMLVEAFCLFISTLFKVERGKVVLTFDDVKVFPS